MRYLLLLLPLAAIGCSDPYERGYASGYYDEGPAYASNYGYSSPSSYGGENCGTPYEPKACPPMPRRPLPYYPGNRW